MNHCQRILNHLRKNKVGITSKTAMNIYGCYRLAARILELRESGHNIITLREKGKNRHGEKVTFARYVLPCR